jgi:hypothetical protein
MIADIIIYVVIIDGSGWRPLQPDSTRSRCTLLVGLHVPLTEAAAVSDWDSGVRETLVARDSFDPSREAIFSWCDLFGRVLSGASYRGTCHSSHLIGWRQDHIVSCLCGPTETSP